MYFYHHVFLCLFLPALLAGYHLLRLSRRSDPQHRTNLLNVFLFCASVSFYAWGELEYVFLLLGSLLVNYGYAVWADRRLRAGLPVRRVVAAAVVFNLALLMWFKYSAFTLEALSELSVWFGGPSLTMRKPYLPIGTSFFTFQAMSYVIDVCRREVPRERSLLRFGVYVFLFPHLIAGPIVRYRDLAAQLGGEGRDVGLERFASGVRRFVFGLAKKLLLADTFAEVADAVFQMPGQLSMSAAWIGVACYSLQIYFDFSGYSDMAIGLARMFGFEFQENFRYPYIASSVTDFWRRWHISLSSWFRDYLYIPLGGNRGGPLATYRNLLIVFVLCGLWHGANWTFLLWGLWHGCFLILERMGLGRRLEETWQPLRHVYTLAAVMGGWVLFRATSIGEAGTIYAAMIGLGGDSVSISGVWNAKMWVALPLGLLACCPIGPWLAARRDELAPRLQAGRAAIMEALIGTVEVAVIAVLLLAVSMQLAASTFSPFIYFRF